MQIWKTHQRLINLEAEQTSLIIDRQHSMRSYLGLLTIVYWQAPIQLPPLSLALVILAKSSWHIIMWIVTLEWQLKPCKKRRLEKTSTNSNKKLKYFQISITHLFANTMKLTSPQNTYTWLWSIAAEETYLIRSHPKKMDNHFLKTKLPTLWENCFKESITATATGWCTGT